MLAPHEGKWADLEPWAHLLAPGRILLLRTGWDRYWGTGAYFDHPYLTGDAAAVRDSREGGRRGAAKHVVHAVEMQMRAAPAAVRGEAVRDHARATARV